MQNNLTIASNNLFRTCRIATDLRIEKDNSRFTIFEVEKAKTYTMVHLQNGEVKDIKSAQNQLTLLFTINS